MRASRIERWFSEAGRPPAIDLARSGAPARSTSDLLELASPADRDAYLRLGLDYGAATGSERLRKAVAASTGARSSEQVIITNGAVEALLLACACALGRGRRVAVAGPAYEGLSRAAEAAGATAVPVPVWGPESPHLSLSRLTPALLSSCAAVVVNSPHNPTGLVADGAELADLARRCAYTGTVLIVDEVASATLDPTAGSLAGAAVFGDTPVVVVGDVSKSLGLGGLRIGWLISAHPALLRRAAELRDLTSMGNSAPSQHLAAVALESRGRLHVGPLARTNLAALREWADTLPGARLPVPVDGMVAFPRLPLPEPSLAFAERVRLRAGVSVAPGAFFGHDDRLRLGLGSEPAQFSEGLARLSAAMAP